jgi:hypothetical protein
MCTSSTNETHRAIALVLLEAVITNRELAEANQRLRDEVTRLRTALEAEQEAHLFTQRSNHDRVPS